MIKFEKPEVWGLEHAIRGMRNPLNSWERSDTVFDGDKMCLGENDIDLMTRLIRGGAPHRKFLRQIFVSVDITAPLYWWKEFDTYKVGTTSNSCSTMHKIHEKVFTLDDFSIEHLKNNPFDRDWITSAMVDEDDKSPHKVWATPLDILRYTIEMLNLYRTEYLETKSKDAWWQLIQLLPSSYNQKRTITMTYENLLNMLEYRRGHKLDEWRMFCDWILTLPYGSLLKEGVGNEQS